MSDSFGDQDDHAKTDHPNFYLDPEKTIVRYEKHGYKGKKPQWKIYTVHGDGIGRCNWGLVTGSEDHVRHVCRLLVTQFGPMLNS